MITQFEFDVLAIRRRLGRDRWGPPQVREYTGPSGVVFTRSDGRRTIIVTCSDQHDDPGVLWLHASIAVQPDGAELPSYEELAMLHRAVWGDTGYAFQAFVPPAEHVNIRQNALHLWGRLDGKRAHPDFGWLGTI